MTSVTFLNKVGEASEAASLQLLCVNQLISSHETMISPNYSLPVPR